MARPRNEDIAKRWLEQVEKAKRKREEWANLYRVDMARDYYRGNQNPGYAANEWITVNKIYSALQVQLPLLYSMDPWFYVKLRKSFSPNPMDIALFEERGKVRGSYLNYLSRELKLKDAARLAILDAHFSLGVLKVHFAAETVRNPRAGSAIEDDDGQPLMGDEGATLVEPDYLPINERYVVQRVEPSDFLWDADAGPLPDKWSWVGEKIRLTKAQARNDKRISRKVLDTLTTVKREEDKDDSDDVYCLWEIYDIKAKKWLILAEDSTEPVMKPAPLPAGVEGHPYCVLRFVLQDDSAYPMPPVSQALDPQREYNLARSRILTHRKRFNRKYQLYGPAFDDPKIEASKLETGDDGTVLISNAPSLAVSPISDAPLDQASYQEVMLLNRDIVELMGSPDEARGVASADSATQAALIDKHLEVREGDRTAIVVDWITEVARKLDQLVQAHISRDEAVRVVGPKGEYWSLVRAADYDSIAGEYEYEVSVGAMQPRLPQVERSQWLAFLQVLASFPHLLLAKRLLKRMGEMHHIDDESMLDELYNLGQQIMSGQMPMPGGGGSQPAQPGQTTNNPITMAMGQALGMRGGAVNGGGGMEQ